MFFKSLAKWPHQKITFSSFHESFSLKIYVHQTQTPSVSISACRLHLLLLEQTTWIKSRKTIQKIISETIDLLQKISPGETKRLLFNSSTHKRKNSCFWKGSNSASFNEDKLSLLQFTYFSFYSPPFRSFILLLPYRKKTAGHTQTKNIIRR